MTNTERSIAEMKALYADYMDTFNRRDFDAIPNFFAFPWAMISAGQIPFVMSDEAMQRQAAAHVTKDIEAQGWSHSTVDKLEVCTTGEDTGLLTSDFTRYRGDGSVIEKKRAYYVVQCRDSRWRIITIVEMPGIR